MPDASTALASIQYADRFQGPHKHGPQGDTMNDLQKYLPMTSAEEAARYRLSGAWPDETIYDRFLRIATQHAKKVAIIEADRQWTYSQVLHDVQALSRGLAAAGVKAGDVVAVQLPNSAEQPIAHLALNRIGALAMPIHDTWHEAELPHLI
jgi:non-ribosomal peptide synthetase component E (peptide arylation enzyme)